MKKIFIFGTGRCGTVSFNKLFQSMQNTFSMHEGIFHKDGAEIRIGDMKEIPKLIYYQGHFKEYLSEAGEIKTSMEKSFASRDRLIKECQGKYKIYCDVNPYAHPMIKFIYKKYPDAYFIHLIRDGYDVVNSYHLREKTTYPSGIIEKDYRGYQSGKPRPMTGDKWLKDWKTFDRVEKISWFWQRVNLDIENKMKVIPESQKILFKLENLDNDSFSELLAKLNIESNFNKKILSKKYNSSNTKLEWTEENIAKFNKIAGSTMKKFEYNVR